MLKSLRSLMLATGLAAAGCALHPSPVLAQEKVQSAPVSLELKSGQVLQFALVRERRGEEAQAVRKRYFETAVPHAASLGDVYLGNLRVKETLIGDNKPRAIALWAFPDVASQDKFRSSPKWPEYVDMRKKGWEELHVYSAVVPKNMRITFSPDKSYTLAVGWTRPNMMDEYERYLDGIEADFGAIGAQYLARFTRIDLQSSVESAAHPTHVTLVEWSGEPDLAGLRGTKAYKANAKNFREAMERFDLYSIHFPIPPRKRQQAR